MVDAHMKDGRTVFRFSKRGKLIDLCKRDPFKLDEDQSLACWVRWNPGDDFVHCRLTNVNKSSIAFTREIFGEERAEFEGSLNILR